MILNIEHWINARRQQLAQAKVASSRGSAEYIAGQEQVLNEIEALLVCAGANDAPQENLAPEPT